MKVHRCSPDESTISTIGSNPQHLNEGGDDPVQCPGSNDSKALKDQTKPSLNPCKVRVLQKPCRRRPALLRAVLRLAALLPQDTRGGFLSVFHGSRCADNASAQQPCPIMAKLTAMLLFTVQSMGLCSMLLILARPICDWSASYFLI